MPRREESVSWKITQMAKEGKSDEEIAEIIGTTPEKVKYQRQRGAVSAENDLRYKFSEDDVDRILHLRNLGWSYPAIAKEVGCDKSTAWAICNPEANKARVARRNPKSTYDPETARRARERRSENHVAHKAWRKATPEIREEVLKLRAEGLSYPEIGRRVGISHSEAHIIVKQNEANQNNTPEPEESQNTVADALDAIDRD